MQDTPIKQAPPRAPKASFASRLFGYDVFISFALGGPPRGSLSYSSDLARRLRERDLSVFFSEDELPPGEPLSSTLKRALLRSKLLVVIVNRGTLELPNWVRIEVETFRSQRPGRPVIPVCLDGCFSDPALSAAVHPWLKHGESIWLDEQPESAARGLATDELVARLLTAPRRLKASTLWRAVVSVATLSLAALASAAAWQAVAAMRERDRVSALRDQILSRQLAAQSMAAVVRDPALALLLAVQSQAVSRTPASGGAVLGVISALPVARMHKRAAAFRAVALAPAGEAMLLSDTRGAVFQGELGQPALKALVQPKASSRSPSMRRGSDCSPPPVVGASRSSMPAAARGSRTRTFRSRAPSRRWWCHPTAASSSRATATAPWCSGPGTRARSSGRGRCCCATPERFETWRSQRTGAHSYPSARTAGCS